MIETIRSWKDPFYRAGLSRRDLADLPSNPAGMVQLSDDELRSASGLASGVLYTPCICCTDTSRPRNCCP